MNLLQRYSKLKKYKQAPDLSGSRYLEHLDYIIKASTPIKGKDYFDGKDGYSPVKGLDYFDGKDGKDGYTPIKNKDYFDGKDGADGKDGYTPVKNKDYFDGKNGRDGKDGINGRDGKDGKDGKVSKASSLTPIQIRNKLEELEGDSRLDASAIKNIGKYASTTVYRTSSSTWGSITGTLSEQTDLVDYIDTKIATNDTSDNINAIVYAIALG